MGVSVGRQGPIGNGADVDRVGLHLGQAADRDEAVERLTAASRRAIGMAERVIALGIANQSGEERPFGDVDL